MAHPFVFEGNFETGTFVGFDSETDTASQLDFPSYKELARFPWPTAVPYDGAYVARLALTGGTADAYVEEADCNIGAGVTNWFRFQVWFSPDFTASANDTFALLELKATGTVEVSFGARVVASTNVINFGIGETAPTSFTAFAIERGKWYTVELKVLVDSGVGNDGTIDLYLTREGDAFATQVACTQVATLDQGAVTDAFYGIQDHLATTTGTILLGSFVQDDARLWPLRRWNESPIITRSKQLFVGPGSIDQAQLLLDSTGDEYLRLWDADLVTANVIAEQSNAILELKAGERTDFYGPLSFHKGCFAEVGGTTPRAQVQFGNTLGRSYIAPPAHNSAAGMRNWARR